VLLVPPKIVLMAPPARRDVTIRVVCLVRAKKKPLGEPRAVKWGRGFVDAQTQLLSEESRMARGNSDCHFGMTRDCISS